jgi:eukaryotic-like serine/threonine-protein kinase
MAAFLRAGRLPTYVLRAPLGRGGMGVVWPAQDAVLGREVAVKEVVFPPTMAEEERRPARARVMREARAAARLNHPGAVTLYDAADPGSGPLRPGPVGRVDHAGERGRLRRLGSRD